MNTGQSDPLMCFNTFILLAFGLNSTVKPGGAMLPFAPPLLPAAKPGGALLPLAPLHWRPCYLVFVDKIQYESPLLPFCNNKT